MTDKELAKQAYLEGYTLGKGVEDMDRISEQTAETRFQQWWDRNHE